MQSPSNYSRTSTSPEPLGMPPRLNYLSIPSVPYAPLLPTPSLALRVPPFPLTQLTFSVPALLLFQNHPVASSLLLPQDPWCRAGTLSGILSSRSEASACALPSNLCFHSPSASFVSLFFTPPTRCEQNVAIFAMTSPAAPPLSQRASRKVSSLLPAAPATKTFSASSNATVSANIFSASLSTIDSALL